MKKATSSVILFAFIAFVGKASAQGSVDLLNLTFEPSNAGDIAAHPDVSNVTPWVNGSEVLPDPFGFGTYYMPDPDFGNGYAGLTVPGARFGYKWGFEGSFDVASSDPWAVNQISFDYDVLGHNGEAHLDLIVAGWSGSTPLPSTSGEDFGPVFDPVTNGERATGSVTFDFAAGTLTVTRAGYLGYVTPLGGSASLGNGTHVIDILVSNTQLLSNGAFDANANATFLADAFYRIDNFRITASPVPEPSGVILMALAGLPVIFRRTRQKLFQS
jgi:hypothetical protein